MADPIVVAEGLHKSFGDTHALRGLDLSVPMVVFVPLSVRTFKRRGR